MKYKILALIGIISLIFWIRPLYSQTNLPYPEIKDIEGGPSQCSQAFINRMSTMRGAWEANLETLTSQEKPVSEMVDEAFEGVRTYRCWLEYLCRSVRYSGPANPIESEGTGLAEVHIGQVPGCAEPEDITIPTISGPAFQYIDKCHAEGLEKAQSNYNECMQYLELNFGQPATENAQKHLEDLKQKSTVFLTLEKKLKQVHAQQSARAMEDKLRIILNKMHAMEGYAQTLKTFIFKLEALLPCYAKPCT